MASIQHSAKREKGEVEGQRGLFNMSPTPTSKNSRQALKGLLAPTESQSHANTWTHSVVARDYCLAHLLRCLQTNSTTSNTKLEKFESSDDIKSTKERASRLHFFHGEDHFRCVLEPVLASAWFFAL